MKACISLYSYWKLVKVGKMTHYDALDEMKRIGAEAVELQVFSASVPKGKSISDYIRDLHAYAVKIGLEVPMLTMCANLYGPTADNDLAFLCELTDILSECGVGFLRSDVTYSFWGMSRAAPIKQSSGRWLRTSGSWRITRRKKALFSALKTTG